MDELSSAERHAATIPTADVRAVNSRAALARTGLELSMNPTVGGAFNEERRRDWRGHRDAHLRSSNHSVVISSSNDHGWPISATPWRYVGLVPWPLWTSVGDDSWPSVVLSRVQSASAPHSDDWPLLRRWRAVSRDLRRRRGRIRSRLERHRVIRGRTVSCRGRGLSADVVRPLRHRSRPTAARKSIAGRH